MLIVTLLWLIMTSPREFPICDAPGDQLFPSAVPGEGGMILVWLDGREGKPTLFAQKIDREGRKLWREDVPLCRSGGKQFAPQAIADGSGGAIVVWVELRGEDKDIYAQRVSGDGKLLWGEKGKPVCVEKGTQDNLILIPDGNGGAIVAWEDWRNGNQDIYAQRISHEGDPVWSENGVPVCTTAGGQYDPFSAADGEGGAVVVWWDIAGDRWDIRAQRISKRGERMWDPEGVPVCRAAGGRGSPRVIPDGSGGAFVVWVDYRRDNGTFRNGDIYAQHLGPDGRMLWDERGMAVCDADGNQQSPIAVNDGSGGMVVAWWDERDVYADVYAQHLDGDGRILWEQNGKPICQARGVQKDVHIVPAGDDKTAIFWRDFREDYEFQPGDFIFAQCLSLSDGKIRFQPDGIPVTESPGEKPLLSAAYDGKGWLLFVWSAKVKEDSDIFGRWLDVRAR